VSPTLGAAPAIQQGWDVVGAYSAGRKGEQRLTRVIAISDSDSYLKWSVATLRALPASWSSTQLLIKNPVLPSPEQARAAAGRPVPVLSYRALMRMLRQEAPDVVLLAATGPSVAALTAAPALRAADRPVLVTGLPGVSVPATPRAITLRAGCDLFLLHSHREIAEFTELAEQLSVPTTFGLASLPYLPRRPHDADPPPPGTDLLFAAQAKVPPNRADREQILLALAEAGSAVVKLRALSTEWQTHHEPWPYPQLYADLVRQQRVAANAVRFVAGPMDKALAQARGLATVSSTAALEAMAVDRPVLMLRDFGVSAEMINTVFEGSGCLGTLADLAAGRLYAADPAWMAGNYFHPAEENTWLRLLDQLIADRTAGRLNRRKAPTGSPWIRARRRLRLAVPPSLWARIQPLWARVPPAPGRRALEPLHGRRNGSAPAGPPAGPPDAHQRPQSATRPLPSGQDR
jgi:putative glycosyltransferase DUF6716